MNENDRQEKSEKLESWDKYKFDGDLDKIIEDLRTFRKAHKQYHRIGVEEETETGYYNESYTNFEVTGLDGKLTKKWKRESKAQRS